MKHITEPLLAMLRAGPKSALELAQSLSSSEPTILRALRALEKDQRVLRMGKTKGARYALRRSVGAIGSRWPLFRIDARGAVHELGVLEALERDNYRVSAGPERMQQLFDAIPYFLQDGRPAGFLGRVIPGVFPELNLPDRVIDWTDEHVLVYLTQRAPDMPGALIVGTESMDRYLAGLQAVPVVPRNGRTREYPRYARLSMQGNPPGPCAQGEQPKFTARVEHNSQRVAVIVKFSPPLSTVTGRRWGDLLRAEYLAHRVLSEHGIAACRSELLQYDERVFLECERFDRVGGEGRRSTVSLFALDASRYRQLDSWTAAAERLAADRLLSATDADQIRLLDAFGALIANTERHFGNITLFDEYDGPFALAPAYDMLPMLFAPQNEQIVPRVFEPPAPRSSWLPVWSRARGLAETYWQRLAAEPTLSDEFRVLCVRSLEAVRGLPTRGVMVAVFLGVGLSALDVHASDPDAPLVGIAEFVNPAQPPSYRLLTEVESERVRLGQSIFNTKWVANGLDSADGLIRNEGLGPLYNAPACGSCHPGGARGLGPVGSGPAPPSLEVMLEMPGNSAAGDPVYGHVLNTAAVGKLEPEGSVSIRYSESYGYYYPDGIRWRLRTPRYDISRLSLGPLAPNTIIKPRVAPALFGVGLLEAVASDALGGKDPHMGRFGWQEASLSVRDQTTRAFSREMGVTSVERPDDDCTPVETDCAQMARSAQRVPEVSEELLVALVAFEHNLAVPSSSAKPRNAALGSELFVRSGCEQCHRSRLPVELPTENGIHTSGVIAAYTDLRLHDLGMEMADKNTSGASVASQWRTAPLWGLGYRMQTENQPTFLHDGRARSAEEAILWHGGEGARARRRFMNLGPRSRAALLNFLETL